MMRSSERLIGTEKIGLEGGHRSSSADKKGRDAVDRRSLYNSTKLRRSTYPLRPPSYRYCPPSIPICESAFRLC